MKNEICFNQTASTYVSVQYQMGDGSSFEESNERAQNPKK